ncbi:hypothetical protein ACP70R_041144 [Stipagrostis hirtigluma subsp. patula]
MISFPKLRLISSSTAPFRRPRSMRSRKSPGRAVHADEALPAITADPLGSTQNGATFPTATVMPEKATCRVAPPLLQNVRFRVLLAMVPTADDTSTNVTDAHCLEPTRSPVVRPAFNLTLRVDNERGEVRTCKEEVTATVFYGGTVVFGWAEVPDFCVDWWSSEELNVPLSHADVLLTDGLRRRLAAELRFGEPELGVEMRMVFPRGILPCDECHESRSRQTLQLCSVKPGKGYAPCLCLFLT